MHKRSYRPLIRVVGFFGVFLLGAFRFGPGVLSETADKPQAQALDLSQAILSLADLPPSFQEMDADQKDSMRSMLELWQGQMQQASNLEVLNFTGYWTADPQNPHFVISGLVSPLTPTDQVLVDRAFADPGAIMEQLSSMVRGGESDLLSGGEDIGESRLAFKVEIDAGSLTMHMDYIVARRGPVLVEVAYIYLQDQEPVVDSLGIARLLDERVAAVVGRTLGVIFRPPGPLVPELTTHIPTPLDVSTRPAVVGTNLFLAAFLMLPFAAAAEFLTRTLGEYEDLFLNRFRTNPRLVLYQERFRQWTGTALSRRLAGRDLLRLLGVIIFYGLVFSLLDRTWNPLSLQGLVLFVSMSVAYGLVGLAADFYQWRAIRRWEMQADMTVRPTNAVLAIISTLTSRLFSIVPGLMFGTPEALRFDEAGIDDARRLKLLRISLWTFTWIGLGSWLLTAITAILQRLPLGDALLSSIGGLEAFLLVIFAVTLENLFVHMLGFPGGLGQRLKRKNRWLWLACLVGVTFIFYHTLLNPRGELAQAVRTGNVQVFIGVVIGFVLLVFGLRYFVNRRKHVPVPVGPLPEPAIPDLPTAESALPATTSHQPPSPTPGTFAAPVRLRPDEAKICPVCSHEIKAEARVCRFCRARFSISLRGYCLKDHAVVGVVAEHRCERCQGEVADLHVESRLLGVPAERSMPTPQDLPHLAPRLLEPGTRLCPACGQVIKAEARICRFCRVALD